MCELIYTYQWSTSWIVSITAFSLENFHFSLTSLSTRNFLLTLSSLPQSITTPSFNGYEKEFIINR